jgi:IS5 family transposase
MKHRPRTPEQDDLLHPRLVDLIELRHELVKLAALIDWEFFEREWAGFFPSITGRPATSPRLVAGLLYLQHAFRLSDEAVVSRWVENPYHQHFTGETFFQPQAPIDPTSLTRWRKRIGEEGAEWLLTKTIEAGRTSGAVAASSLEQVAVDTTVMEKASAHPTDSRLLERARAQLVDLAREAGLELRQSYARLAPRLAAQVGRYAHAKQFRRMRKALRTLKGTAGRVLRAPRAGSLARSPRGHCGSGCSTRWFWSPGWLAPDAKKHRQDPRAARAAGGLHLEGQGAGAPRVRHQGQHRHHAHRRLHRRPAVVAPAIPIMATPSPRHWSRSRSSPTAAPAPPWSTAAIAATGSRRPAS